MCSLKKIGLMRNKVIVMSSIIFLVAALVAGLFIYLPKTRKIEELKGALRQEQEKNSLREKIGRLQEGLTYYQQRLVDRRGASWLVDEVSRMAEDSRVKFFSVEPLSPIEGIIYIQLPVRLKAECSYHGLGRFISKIESLKKFIKIDSMELKAIGKGSEGNTKAELELIMSTFYLK